MLIIILTTLPHIVKWDLPKKDLIATLDLVKSQLLSKTKVKALSR